MGKHEHFVLGTVFFILFYFFYFLHTWIELCVFPLLVSQRILAHNYMCAYYRRYLYSTVGCRRTVCRRTARLEFHLKIRTTPGWKNELRTVSPHANSVSCEDDFFGGIADFETTPLRRRASSHTVCALQANLRDSKTDWKLRTRLAWVVKNENDPGWDHLPPVLRHPTVLYCLC